MVIEAYASGDATVAELADVYGCRNQTIYNYLGNHVKRKRITTPDVREQVLLWAKRTYMTTTEIARRVELGRSTVYYILNGRKKHASTRHHQSSQDNEQRAKSDSRATQGTPGGTGV